MVFPAELFPLFFSPSNSKTTWDRLGSGPEKHSRSPFHTHSNTVAHNLFKLLRVTHHKRPPCQGFSMAGKRVKDDVRNQLVFSYIKFIKIVQPKMLLFENVKGFTYAFNKNKRNDVDWKQSSVIEKITYSLIGLFAIMFGCVLGHIMGNSVITYTGITDYWYSVSIFVVSGLCSLKIVDAIVKNSDDVIQLITTGVKRVIENFINKWGGN